MSGAMNGATALLQQSGVIGGIGGWVAGDASPEAIEAKKRTQSVGAAQPCISVPVAGEIQAPVQTSSVLKPPPSALRAVDARAAGKAWDSVIGILSGALRVAGAATKGDGKGTDLALNDLGKATESLQVFYQRALNPEAVLLQIQLESTRFTADMTRANLEHSVDLRKEQLAAIREKQRNEKEAAEKQQDLARKVGKGEIVALAMGWATSLAQVAAGALKVVTGQPQGALDLTAGMLGIAKCTLQSVQAAHPELSGKLGSHIKELAKWEAGFSVAASLTSVISVTRMTRAANGILGKAVSNLLENGAQAGTSSVGVTLVRAFDKGGEAAQAATQLIKDIAKTVVDDVADQVRNSLRWFGGSQKVVDKLARAFSNEAMEKMVENALRQAAKQMSGMTTEAVQNGFISEVRKQLLRALARAAANVIATLDAVMSTARIVAPATQTITHFALNIEAGKMKEEIDRMMIRAMMLQFVIELIGRQVKENKKALERVTQDQVETTEKISNALGEIRDVALDAVSAGI